MVTDRPHRRLNQLTGDWVLVSPGRTDRPWQGSTETKPPSERPTYDPQCYLCPGNERASGARNDEYDRTYVFTNDFAALRPDGERESFSNGLLRSEVAPGTCRVICYSPRHDLDMASMEPKDIRAVVDLWAEQTEDLSASYRWVQVFENKGAAMGASNPHPHGQVWAGSALPLEPSQEDARQANYFDERGSRLLLDYLAQEVGGERVVAENASWVALVPYWAVWPFELLLIPRAEAATIPDLDDVMRDDLAEILADTLAGYDRLFDQPFPYSMGWHGAPAPVVSDRGWQLHAHFYPPLLRSASVRKHMVGYELLAEPQRDLTPEEAAVRLREAVAMARGA